MRGSGIAATLVASVVGLTGLVVAGVLVHGFLTGWLEPYWTELSDPQAGLISGIATMYAAIFVATVVPVLFGGLIGELKRATKVAVTDLKADTDLALQELRGRFDELASEFKVTVERNREASDAIVAMVEESKQSLNTLMHYQLAQIGLKRNYTAVEQANAPNILKECHGTLEFICQSLLDRSRLRANRERFSRTWVGYKPYIDALRQHGLIDDDRQRLMLKIAESRRYLRSDAGAITLVDLNLVASATDDLKSWFESRREAQSHAVVVNSVSNGGIAPSYNAMEAGTVDP